MKKLLSIILIICYSEARGQEVPFKYLNGSDSILGLSNGDLCSKNVDTVLIDNDSLFNYWSASCEWKLDKPDFSKYIILGATYNGDCHMTIDPKVIKNDSDKTYTLRTESRYGGCRAGGTIILWIVIEKPKEKYQIKFEEIYIDR